MESCSFIGLVENKVFRIKVSTWPKCLPSSLKALDLYIINLYLVNFGKFVNSKSSWKNEVDIKSLYMCHQNLGLGLENICSRSWLQQGGSGLSKREVGISSWDHYLGVCNSLKWLAFPKFQLNVGVVVIVEAS